MQWCGWSGPLVSPGDLIGWVFPAFLVLSLPERGLLGTYVTFTTRHIRLIAMIAPNGNTNLLCQIKLAVYKHCLRVVMTLLYRRNSPKAVKLIIVQ